MTHLVVDSERRKTTVLTLIWPAYFLKQSNQPGEGGELRGQSFRDLFQDVWKSQIIEKAFEHIVQKFGGVIFVWLWLKYTAKGVDFPWKKN